MTAAELIQYIQNIQQHNNLDINREPINVKFVDTRTGQYVVIQPDTLAFSPTEGYVLQKVNDNYI